MQQSCMYGSVRGALGNRRPYRDNIPFPSYFLVVVSVYSLFGY
jgi:hypothetical protein